MHHVINRHLHGIIGIGRQYALEDSKNLHLQRVNRKEGNQGEEKDNSRKEGQEKRKSDGACSASDTTFYDASEEKGRNIIEA